MRRAFALLVVVLLLAIPTEASAQQTLAPPGKAGADQYFETIPSSAGNAAPPSGTGSIGAGNGNVSAATLRELSRSKDGRAAAAFAAGTAPRSSARRGAVGASKGSPPGSTALQPLGGSDAGGLGVALPILLATVTLVLVALALATRRGRREAT